MYKSKKGLISLLVILFVLVSSAAIVFVVAKTLKKDATVDAVNNTGTPIGTVSANTSKITNAGSLQMRALNVQGAFGAQIDNVRYYLYNPQLASGHNWGDPSWCASANPCTKDNHPGVFTYDISQSSNPGNNYEVIWDGSTHSSGSTVYSRALTPQNIPPGTYIIGLRVEDVDGNVSGGASSLTITVTSAATSGGTCSFTPSSTTIGGTVTVSSIGVSGQIVLWAGPLTATPFNVGSLAAPGSVQVTIPLDVPFILPPDAPNPPSVTAGYFVVGGVTCSGTLTINKTNNLTGFGGVPTSLNVRVPRYGMGKAFSFTNNTGAVATFIFYGYPTTYGPGINWYPASGGIQAGATIKERIQATGTVAPAYGSYFGTGRLQNGTNNTEASFPVTVQVYCPDMNSDGRVNSGDQLLLSKVYGTRGDNLKEDLNADGVVNSADQFILTKNFGLCS